MDGWTWTCKCAAAVTVVVFILLHLMKDSKSVAGVYAMAFSVASGVWCGASEREKEPVSVERVCVLRICCLNERWEKCRRRDHMLHGT